MKTTTPMFGNLRVVNRHLNDPYTSLRTDQEAYQIMKADMRLRMFHESDSSGIYLVQADLTAMNLFGFSFIAAQMDCSKLTASSFNACDMRNASLRYATAINCCFDGADLSYADVSGADLAGSTFVGAKVTGVNFSDAASTLGCEFRDVTL